MYSPTSLQNLAANNMLKICKKTSQAKNITIEKSIKDLPLPNILIQIIMERYQLYQFLESNKHK